MHNFYLRIIVSKYLLNVKMYILLIVVLFLPHLISSETLPPTICLFGNNCYQGAWIVGSNTTFASFQGIKYAKAPIGKLR